MNTISVGETKSHLSEFVSRAAAGERFVIERRGRPVAALVGADTLERLERSADLLRRLAQALGQSEAILAEIASGAEHPITAAFGLMADQPEWDETVAEIYRQRRQGDRRATVTL